MLSCDACAARMYAMYCPDCAAERSVSACKKESEVKIYACLNNHFQDEFVAGEELNIVIIRILNKYNNLKSALKEVCGE